MVSAYMIALPFKCLAARPTVCVKDLAERKNPSLSASKMATRDTSGRSRPSRSKLTPTSTSNKPLRRSCIISTRSSVSTALNLLKAKNLIKHESYGLIELTEKGEKLGKVLDERHSVIKKFFIDVLGIHPEIADADACKMEHHISPEILNCFINYLAFVKDFPKFHEEYLDHFKNSSKTQQIFPETEDDIE